MNAKELLEKVKAVFNGVPPVVPAPAVPVQAAPASFEKYDVEGGQTVYCSSSIAVSSPVYIDEALTMPYPDGTFTVSGTNFSFTVAGGVVTATTGDLTAVQVPAVPAMPPVQTMPQLTALEAEVNALKQENVKLTAALEVSNTLIQKHEKIIPDLFNLCEELTKVPTSDPVTLTGRKKEVFERKQKAEDKINIIADNLKKIRQNKN